MIPFKPLVRQSHWHQYILFSVALGSLSSSCIHLGRSLNDYVMVWVQRYTSSFRMYLKKNFFLHVSFYFIYFFMRILNLFFLLFHMFFFFFGLYPFFFKFYFIFKLYNIVLVLPNIKMNPPQVYMCSPSRTLLPPPSPYPPSGSSQCTSPKHPVSCIEPGLATHFIHDIIHVSMPFSL